MLLETHEARQLDERAWRITKADRAAVTPRTELQPHECLDRYRVQRHTGQITKEDGAGTRGQFRADTRVEAR